MTNSFKKSFLGAVMLVLISFLLSANTIRATEYTIRQLTDNEHDDEYQEIHNGQVVWCAGNYDEWDEWVSAIFFYDGANNNPVAYVEFQAIRKEAGETDEGYVKRTEIKGYPAIELYDKKSRTSQIQVLVKDSYILKVESEQPVTSQTLKSYAEQTLKNL